MVQDCDIGVVMVEYVSIKVSEEMKEKLDEDKSETETRDGQIERLLSRDEVTKVMSREDVEDIIEKAIGEVMVEKHNEMIEEVGDKVRDVLEGSVRSF